MKNIITSLLFVCIIAQAQAKTLYEQLCEFNFNWKDHSHEAPTGRAIPEISEKAYVQAHLSSVIPILKSHSNAHLTLNEQHSRQQLIQYLSEYCAAGEFPINRVFNFRLPIFIDETQTHCAVAYLLMRSGHEDIALEIAEEFNYSWVKDIHNDKLNEWQTTCGLSIDELKLIQGAYDSYLPNALVLANRYEIPQKPAVMTMYFEDENPYHRTSTKNEERYIWCKGEGENGVLNGRWEQNYGKDKPWIVGYYENGNKTGQWLEYYPNSKQLCRTENWFNDKLNGYRKRFDRDGKLIEEILFRDGEAVTKINYDLVTSLTWVRTPLDSSVVMSEVYTFEGDLIAKGKEKIYNPDNLMWFQNIELTTLNSVAITARDLNTTSLNVQSAFGNISFNDLYVQPTFSPQLVEYKKVGDWTYYKQYDSTKVITSSRPVSLYSSLHDFYPQFATAIFSSVGIFNDLKVTSSYDSINVKYQDNQLTEFIGRNNKDYAHVFIEYHPSDAYQLIAGHNVALQPLAIIKTSGLYNNQQEKIGTWKHYDKQGQIRKIENFVLPKKDKGLVSTR